MDNIILSIEEKAVLKKLNDESFYFESSSKKRVLADLNTTIGSLSMLKGNSLIWYKLTQDDCFVWLPKITNNWIQYLRNKKENNLNKRNDNLEWKVNTSSITNNIKIENNSWNVAAINNWEQYNSIEVINDIDKIIDIISKSNLENKESINIQLEDLKSNPKDKEGLQNLINLIAATSTISTQVIEPIMKFLLNLTKISNFEI